MSHGDTFMQILTYPANSPTPSTTYLGTARPTPPATTTELQVGTPATTADTWRQRYYALAYYAQFRVAQVAQAGITAATTEEQLANCWGLALDWPPGIDITTPLSQLAGSLVPYYEQLAAPDVEPDIANY